MPEAQRGGVALTELPQELKLWWPLCLYVMGFWLIAGHCERCCRARHQYMYWSIYKWPKKNIVMPRRAERPRQPPASRRRKHKVWITAFLYQSVQYLAKAVLSTTFVLSSILISRS